MTTPNADVVAAVRQMLLDDAAISALVTDRIWGGSLPRSEDASMPRKNIVISRGGKAPSAGTNSYIGIQRVRLDIRCYGEDPFEAGTVYRHVDAFLKAVVPQTVDLADGGVRVHNAIESMGGIDMVDPDTDWPSVACAWSVSTAETVTPLAIVSS